MTGWDTNSWIIVAVGFLAASACAMLGVFLVLRRLSLVADAISHAVLPGIAIAFIISGSRATIPMLIGAALVGMFTTTAIEWLHSRGRIQSDAATGIVFTALFAFGVILISAKAGMVDLDQECVLYGEIAYSPWDTLMIGGASWGPKPLWVLGSMTLINGLFVLLFYKELKLSTFDPMLSTTLGFSAALLQYVLMGLTSLTTVAAFDSVGAILVVGMFVAPAATAYLMADSLAGMIVWALVAAAGSSVGGYALARMMDASVAGGMTVASGILFTLALFLSPGHGLIPRWRARFALRFQIAVEDFLGMIYRKEEGSQTGDDPETIRLAYSPLIRHWVVRRRLAERAAGGWTLTAAGLKIAEEVVRRYRSWEGYLVEEWGTAPDHVHRSAHQAEHFLGENIADVETVINPDRSDPHGSAIP